MRAPRYELPTPPPHNLGGPSSPYRSRGRAARSTPTLQTGKGRPRRARPRPQLASAPAGWWRGFHGALWSDPQLAEHAALEMVQAVGGGGAWE